MSFNKRITVKVLDGKENTQDESRVTYLVGIPSDILFFEKDGIVYSSFWDTALPPNLIQIPVRQIVAID